MKKTGTNRKCLSYASYAVEQNTPNGWVKVSNHKSMEQAKFEARFLYLRDCKNGVENEYRAVRL